MQKNTLVAFSLISLISAYLNAVIPEIEIWEQEATQESQTTDRRYRYLLKDIHLDFKGAKNTIQQQQDILWILQQNKDTNFAIVEDSSSLFQKFMAHYELTTKGFTNLSFPESLDLVDMHNKSRATIVEGEELYRASPLEFLAHFCENAGIQTHNVECDTIIKACDFLMSSENEHEHEDIQKAVRNELYTYIHDLESYGYNSCDALHQRHALLASLIGKSDKKSFLAIATNIRSIILETRILHELCIGQKIKNGYVITGAKHIDCIKQNLPLLGYKHIKTIGTPVASYITELLDKEKNTFRLKETILNSHNILIRNSLDLRKTFIEIFNEQNRNSKQ